MKLIVCPACGQQTGAASRTCPRCGAVVRRGFPWGWATLAMLGLMLAIAWAFPSPAASGGAGRTWSGEIIVGRRMVELVAAGGADLPAGLQVFVNGPPYGDTRRATVDGFVVGPGRAVIPVEEFVSKRGQRFSAAAEAVVEVWVGGAGYDYSNYRVSR